VIDWRQVTLADLVRFVGERELVPVNPYKSNLPDAVTREWVFDAYAVGGSVIAVSSDWDDDRETCPESKKPEYWIGERK
jgi:hypothetical protein